MIALLIIFSILIGFLAFVYYIIILIDFANGDYYRDRTRLLYDLIPFRLWAVKIKENWIESKDLNE